MPAPRGRRWTGEADQAALARRQCRPASSGLLVVRGSAEECSTARCLVRARVVWTGLTYRIGGPATIYIPPLRDSLPSSSDAASAAVGGAPATRTGTPATCRECWFARGAEACLHSSSCSPANLTPRVGRRPRDARVPPSPITSRTAAASRTSPERLPTRCTRRSSDSTIDLDEVARAASEEAERARHWIEHLARSLAETGGAARSPEDPLVQHAGPHPLALPTAEQGGALAALESGRWRIESGTFSVHDGPGPSEPVALLRELRVSDWVTADGELTLSGRRALARAVARASTLVRHKLRRPAAAARPAADRGAPRARARRPAPTRRRNGAPRIGRPAGDRRQ